MPNMYLISLKKFTHGFVYHALNCMFDTPIGYMHCLKGAFTSDDNLTGLKSHDWHKFLQFVLPIAIKDCLTENIGNVIYKISGIARWISKK